MKKHVYLDYAAAVPIDNAVGLAVYNAEKKYYGNPGALHSLGRTAKEVIRDARLSISKVLFCRADELIFTSGGTESNNLAIQGFIKHEVALGRSLASMRVITTAIEHPSVLYCLEQFKESGLDVVYVPVSREGLVRPEDVLRMVNENTVLVSIGLANSEIGVVQPISTIGRLLEEMKRENGKAPIFHTDASQAPLYLDMSVEKMRVDMMTIDGQKIGGPRGIGCLYVGHGVEIDPLLYGGGQEGGMRPGTENVSGCIGLALALGLANTRRVAETERLRKMQAYCFDKIPLLFPGTEINGSLESRLPNNINVSFPNIDTDFLVIELDHAGFECSTKSACSEGEVGSRVVAALGKESALSQSTLRVTFGRGTKGTDIKKFVAILAVLLKKKIV
jgi:cysteine desulfurase